MGLPKEQVEMMDAFFKEMRERKAGRSGCAEGGGDIGLGAASRRLESENGLPNDGTSKSAAAVALSADSRTADAAADGTASKDSAPLRGARLLHELDQCAAEKEKVRAEGQRRELVLASRGGGGAEPSKFEQAAGEVSCAWALPGGHVAGRDIRVSALEGGTRLKVEVLGVRLFDRKLFGTVRTNDVVWSVDQGELQVVLTKVERNKLWEQLDEVSEVRWDNDGEVIAESIPAPLSSAERLSKFREMVQGDDGQQADWDDLDPRTKQLVEAMRRYEHARATGNNDALALAEMDLEEYGQVII